MRFTRTPMEACPLLTRCKNLADSWEASYFLVMTPFACNSVSVSKIEKRVKTDRLDLSITAIMRDSDQPESNAHKIH